MSHHISRRGFLKVVGIAAASLAFDPVAFGDIKKKPNILYIMADDQSPESVACYGGWMKDHVQTSNIDKLAAEGMRFENCVCTNSLCAPSRASIATGQYSHKTGVYTLREDMDTKDKPTSYSVLNKAGYQTAVFGKWHVHGDNKYGLDDYGVTISQGSYYNPTLTGPGGIKRRFSGMHSTDAYTYASLEWLDKRDKDKPFLLMCHYKAAHGDWIYAKRFEELYADVEIPEPATLFDDYSNRASGGVNNKKAKLYPNLAHQVCGNGKKPGAPKRDWPTGNIDLSGMDEKQQKKATFQKYAKDYMRCVAGINENVGKLVKYLKDEGILENTIVIYTADQGMYVGEHGFYDKRLMLEEGLRMPFIVRYPKMIKSGAVTKALVNNVDFAPTLLDLAGEKTPSSMQGKSFADVLKGKKDKHRKSSFYAFYSNGVQKHYGVRTERYKLIVWAESGLKDLFDIVNDPHELTSLYGDPKYVSLVKEMEEELKNAMIDADIAENELPGKRLVANKVKATKDDKVKPAKEKKQKVKVKKKNKHNNISN
ncbi:MAG: sulfatase [Phycisphaerae bacterium]|nr:sulfatase [Phycisphaerae bacterium]